MKTNNHPAHGHVSLDRLHQISEILSKAAAQSGGGNLGYAMTDAVKVIDVAIAAFNAEPVAWQWEYRDKRHVTNDQRRAKFVAEYGDLLVQPLYTAPPVQADKSPLLEFAKEYIDSWELGMPGDSGLLESARKAIADSETRQPAPLVDWVPLGDSPYDVPYSMPSNLRELIAEEIGILFSVDDAQSVWNVCRSAAMLKAGNSPVIPDTWIPVSERMPNEGQEIIVMDVVRGKVQSGMIYQNGRFVDFNEEYYEVKSPSHWMPLPAAPQQEVKS